MWERFVQDFFDDWMDIKEVSEDTSEENVKKNEATKDIEGTYTLSVTGKEVKITDDDGHTGIAKCDPVDEFDIDEGMKIAFDRMLEDRNGIHEGDIVEVISNGSNYSTYSEWVYKNVDGELKCNYAYGESSGNKTLGRVIKIAPHSLEESNIRLVYFQTFGCPSKCYLIDYDGLKKVE